MKLHPITGQDITRADERHYGKLCAHEIADAFARVPADVEVWLENLPDDLPAFVDAFEWVASNTPSVLPAMQGLRRHYVTRCWVTKDPKSITSTIEFRLDHPPLNAAWRHCLRYVAMFASQAETPDRPNPMRLATPAEAAMAFRFMRQCISKTTSKP